jgi:hypothetical protein
MTSTPFYSWRPHPWHGLETGPAPPSMVYAYIEITPYDSIKYEVDKATGYLLMDRPHRISPPHRPVVPRGLRRFAPRPRRGTPIPWASA